MPCNPAQVQLTIAKAKQAQSNDATRLQHRQPRYLRLSKRKRPKTGSFASPPLRGVCPCDGAQYSVSAAHVQRVSVARQAMTQCNLQAITVSPGSGGTAARTPIYPGSVRKRTDQ